MKKYLTIFAMMFVVFPALCADAASLRNHLAGRIVLQIEENGEAWYVEPTEQEVIFLGRPRDAFEVMRSKGLGVSNNNLDLYDGIAPQKLSGKILLQVEENGEAWYVDPVDLKMHYLGRPHDAFGIMRSLGLGISNSDFENLKEDHGVIVQEVAFSSQAPFGDWNDVRQQEGCEEASSYMAVKWARGDSFTPIEALDEILKISDYELREYGQYIDTSAKDTMDRILGKYFNFSNANLFENVSKQFIINELLDDKIIIIPSNGRKLSNPNFTSPGPLIHMLVVKGYDEGEKQFITNDPGTRNGESYRYDEDILFNAISDYVTGEHVLTNEKNIIVVQREK